MRRILLTSASIVAFAGAAAAQEETPTGIIFSGDAALGFNDATAGDAGDGDGKAEDSGFFYEANLGVTLRTILDSGAVAESTFTIPVADSNLGNELTVDDDFVLGLSIDGVGSLQLGDVPFAGESFSFVNMQSADFSEQDSETVLRGGGSIAGFEVAGSALILDEDGDQPGAVDVDGDGDDDDTNEDYIDQISVGGEGAIGPVALTFGYQSESDIIVRESSDLANTPDLDDTASQAGVFDTNNGDFNPAEQFGLGAGFAFRGAQITLGYGRNLSGASDGRNADGSTRFTGNETQSYGVLVSYPFGPVTVSAEYDFEPDAEEFGSDTEYSYNLGAAYETTNLIIEAEYGEEIGEEEYDIKVGYAFSDVTQVQAGYNDDDGTFVAIRQGIGAGAFVEGSYAEVDDAGFGNDDFANGAGLADDIRPGATLRVGLEF